MYDILARKIYVVIQTLCEENIIRNDDVYEILLKYYCIFYYYIV